MDLGTVNTASWLTWWTFLGLKLSGVIAWSWWIVAIPLMVAVPVTIWLLVLLVIGYGILAIVNNRVINKANNDSVFKDIVEHW